jgi:uncharacterized membrane protein YgaE (UPF0421/DUF939 family)
MRFRTLLALVVLLLLGVFVVVNWEVFAARAKLSFVFVAVEAPIGVVMLAVFALVLAILSGAVGAWQGTLLLEFRRQAKELQAQRALAEDAEGSRFTELATLVREEIAKSNQHLEQALEALRAELHATENSIAATLGEMDDRYGRGAQGHERPG